MLSACDICGSTKGLRKVFVYGTETVVCGKCRGEDPDLDDLFRAEFVAKIAHMMAPLDAGLERLYHEARDAHTAEVRRITGEG